MCTETAPMLPNVFKVTIVIFLCYVILMYCEEDRDSSSDFAYISKARVFYKEQMNKPQTILCTTTYLHGLEFNMGLTNRIEYSNKKPANQITILCGKLKKMAAFACFSSSEEKTTASYKDLIERLRRDAQKEMENTPPAFCKISLKYFATYNTKKEHNFKDFIYNLRMKMVDMTCILLCDNPTPKFKCFVRLIERLKLKDGVRSNAYYGEIKKIVTGFLNYFTYLIDDVVRAIDKYTHNLDNKLFMKLVDDTVSIETTNQAAFLEEYLPLTTETEKIKYQQVVDSEAKFLEGLGKIRDTWAGKQDRLDVFAKECFEASLQKINYLCTFAHTYISMMLADRIYEISVSLGETVDRMNANLRKCNQLCTRKKNMMIQNLYEKNKEQLEIYRRMVKRSTDTAEVMRTIEVLKDQIENFGNEETIARLELETRYWNKRMRDFNEIASALTRMRIELDSLEEDLKKYRSIRVLELPGAKTMCFDLIGENINERILYLRGKQLDMSRALITFFCVRGTDRILYTDNVGSYYCDEFNHQNYITNYGLKFLHVNCYGDFLEKSDTEPYYFDECGRYVLRDGEKIHQAAPCTSEYKLGDDGFFKKITSDCGHSETPNPDCRMAIKDLTDVVLLPKNDPIDITGMLDSESVKYLWDSYGMILPEVLNTVAKKQPKNPIHFMAHILLKRRFEATATEVRQLRKMADKYRTKFYQDRKNKAIEARREWKAKLMKRRKPEEFDDSQEWAAYNLQASADWLFVNSMGYYN